MPHTSAAHTPGPWTYRPGTRAIVGAVDNQGDYQTVGHLSESMLMDQDTKQANAALIAAAPELLEACKYLVHLVGKENVPGNIVAAIARATSSTVPA